MHLVDLSKIYAACKERVIICLFHAFITFIYSSLMQCPILFKNSLLSVTVATSS